MSKREREIEREKEKKMSLHLRAAQRAEIRRMYRPINLFPVAYLPMLLDVPRERESRRDCS